MKQGFPAVVWLFLFLGACTATAPNPAPTQTTNQAQSVLPFNATTVAVITQLERPGALAEVASSFVREGYRLDFGTMDDQQFSTLDREVRVADDLEFLVDVRHTVMLLDTEPLAAIHIKTMWNYAGMNKPVDAAPQALAAYKEKYVPVYTNRIRLYIEAFVSEFEYTLLAYPLTQ